MPKLPNIGIDLMGGDTPPQDLYRAVLQLIEENASASFTVFASDEVAQQLRPACPLVSGCEVILMDDSPREAIRRKKEASLCKGIRYLKNQQINAFVTAGNTGALLISANMILSTIPEIERPALMTLLPTKKKEVAVLDVGANLSFQPHHLFQFAQMGIAYQKSRGITNPSVGLLNIGVETEKGTPALRQAYAQLESLNRDQMTFLGNIEGKEVFNGNIDVLVTDGFTGNIFLKTAEGVASFILDELEGASHIQHQLYQAASHGAILCGVDGIIVKCHGDSTPATFLQGIKGAIRLCEHHFLEKIKSLV